MNAPLWDARYMSTGIGRFISPDSIVPNPSDARDHNRYTYVKNNPLKYTDPSGHCSYIGEFSHCDYVEDGANYSFGKKTTFAKKRMEVHDNILDTYDVFVGRTGSSILSDSFAADVETLVHEAQASARSDREEKIQELFGPSGTWTTDNHGEITQSGPSIMDFVVGNAEIAAGVVVTGVGVAEAYAAGVLVIPTLGGSLLILIPAVETAMFGLDIMSDGACRAGSVRTQRSR